MHSTRVLTAASSPAMSPGRWRHHHRRFHEPKRHGRSANRLWHVTGYHQRSQGADRKLRCPVRRHDLRPADHHNQSGGEKFHGAAYEYLRNDVFNAFQYGDQLVEKPPDKENDYGANIGGPILLPKLHGPNSFFKGYFYFNWEGFQDHGAATRRP